MKRPVQVFGIDASGLERLSSRARDALASATFVAGGKRHLALAGCSNRETFAITNNLDELVARLESRGPDERCVVLASGDPLLFGVGATLIRALGADHVVVEPTASSVQLAFARIPCAWHDATIASVHGRPLAETLLPLLGKPKIGLLTQNGAGPEAVAEFFLSRGLDDYTAWVCEDLAAPGERVTRLPLRDLVGQRFADLNVVVLIRRRGDGPPRRDEVPPDEQFARPGSGALLLTHRDIRLLSLNRFEGVPEGPLWDLGAGLGGIAVGLANRFRGSEVVAVERSEAQVALLQENRRRFEAWNLRIVAGEAPEALAGEADPAGVFVGGSGGRLDDLLNVVIERLRPGGVVVANFVALENLARTSQRLRAAGWPVEVTQASFAYGDDLAGLTTFLPRRPVWVVRAVRG